jgi:hypothetical protein
MSDKNDKNVYIFIGFLIFSIGIAVLLSDNKKNKCEPQTDRYEIEPRKVFNKGPVNDFMPSTHMEQYFNKGPVNDFMPTQYPQDDRSVEIIEYNPPLSENYQVNSTNPMSTFCNCDGMIAQNCVDPKVKVDSYNAGNTEFSKFPDKGWDDIMPYDQYIQTPNYYNQNTNWFDPMPESIYEKNLNRK